MRTACIVNPLSGGKRGRQLIGILQESETALQKAQACRIVMLEDLPRCWSEIKFFDRLLIAGGDGTISGLLPLLLESSAAIGIIPLGTGNDLAKELKVHFRFSTEQFLDRLDFYFNAATRPFSIWRLLSGPDSGRNVLFCNYVSLGFDAAAAADFSAWRSGSYEFIFSSVGGNRLGYLAAAVKNLRRGIVEFARISSRSEERHLTEYLGVRSIIISNIKSFAGIGSSNPDGDAFDRRIEVTVVRSIKEYIGMLGAGKSWLPQPESVGSAESWELACLPDSLRLQVDGETRPDLSPSGLRVEFAGSINMMVA